ncbi:MAG: LptA/OstA family protein [Rubellimicrobium sp.]|nr:LptA/OstA family protein [Rubellimicrobium sp.]
MTPAVARARPRVLVALLVAVLAVVPPAAMAQADVVLGGLSADLSAPVEVTADSLSVDQATRRAVFAGNVVIGQGAMRIAAGQVEVIYSDATGEIAHLLLSGGVTFVTATEQAEAGSADYDLTTGMLVLAGDVLLTQGANALAADRMEVNLKDGTARMEGRVRTVFGQGG